mmetsp:Transcript_12631/g.19654  ORF Transcript_12631/g.19654 Transcript_12631/m.19654 type:complete len:105 (+) Transcript_12631:4161-4475(+)
MFVINLKRTNKSNKQFVQISNYPKPKECTWFVLLGNAEKNELFALKRIAFKRFASKKISIALPQNFDSDKLSLYLFCDSYIGVDQVYDIDFNDVNSAIARGSMN